MLATHWDAGIGEETGLAELGPGETVVDEMEDRGGGTADDVAGVIAPRERVEYGPVDLAAVVCVPRARPRPPPAIRRAMDVIDGSGYRL